MRRSPGRERAERTACGCRKRLLPASRRARRWAWRTGRRRCYRHSPLARHAVAAAMWAETAGFVLGPMACASSRASCARCGPPAPGSSRKSSPLAGGVDDSPAIGRRRRTERSANGAGTQADCRRQMRRRYERRGTERCDRRRPASAVEARFRRSLRSRPRGSPSARRVFRGCPERPRGAFGCAGPHSPVRT